MKKTPQSLLIVMLLIANEIISYGNNGFGRSTVSSSGPGMTIVTYVTNNEQVRQAGTLIRSLRKNGGKLGGSDVYIVVTDTMLDLTVLEHDSITHFLDIDIERSFLRYPLAVKAFAGAQVEKILPQNSVLAWFDPETIILSPPSDLLPGKNEKVVIQPVFQSNTISQAPGNPLNDYWKPIYDKLALDPASVPVVESAVDRQKMLAYYNCEIFSARASAGIFSEWTSVLEDLLHDTVYSFSVCNTYQRRLFLHQAVLSAVISKNIRPSEIKTLPLRSGYPLHSYTRLPEERKAASLNDVSCAILENLWSTNPGWIKEVKADEPLMAWLEEEYLRYMEIGPGLFRQEGSCNSYLVVTGDSSVIIDPAGAVSFPYWFEKVLAKKPLAAMMLTHGHNDHRDNLSYWKKDRDIPVTGQGELKEFVAYNDMLGGFFARRNAIWSGKTVPETWEKTVTDPGVTDYFSDTMTIMIGDRTFRLIHTSGETPDHTVIWIPELKAAFVGDNYYSSFPNLYTLRGTRPRWALEYIEGLDTALNLNPYLFLPGHGQWLKGNDQRDFYVKGYRNAIQYVHDETVKGMNEGKSRYALMREVKLPREYYFINQAYGTVAWSVRGIYEGYAGWFDENPVSMYPIPVSDIYSDLAVAAGKESLIKLADKYLSEGEYVKALHITGIIISAYPDDEEAVARRKEALTRLQSRTYNYIEDIWLRKSLSEIK